MMGRIDRRFKPNEFLMQTKSMRVGAGFVGAQTATIQSDRMAAYRKSDQRRDDLCAGRLCWGSLLCRCLNNTDQQEQREPE
jgi:hypothetical protein